MHKVSEVFQMEVSDELGEIWNYAVSMEICQHPKIVLTWKQQGLISMKKSRDYGWN